MENLSGVITKSQSGFFTAHTAQGDVVCHIRGKLKHQRQATDLVAVGDEVEISVQPDGKGMIEKIAPRRRELTRRGAAHRGQVILANPDVAVFVFACSHPTPNPRLIDRFLVVAEAADLPAILCANKTDLVTPAEAEGVFGLYTRLGYRVVYTSAAQQRGIEELRELLRGKISVFSGPSGVGKSSLLNALQPGLALQAHAVSQATTKGRHTTVHPELVPLAEGGYVADTPGIRTIAPWDVEPLELDAYFIDIRPYVAHCAFSDCSHLHEPGCAVREAVQTGNISPSRYDSYCRMRRSEKEDLE